MLVPDKAVFLPGLDAVGFWEIGTVFFLAVSGYVLFNNFEKHLSLGYRIMKLMILVGLLTSLGILLGRWVFWGAILLMTLGQLILHLWYFPKNGINGLTAEPRKEYLALIEKMKGK